MNSNTIQSSAMEPDSPDNEPPVLNQINPYPGVSFFQADQPIRLFFNKAIVAGSGNVILSNGLETRTIAITDTDQISFDGESVTIQPTTDLMADTTYSIQIASGVIVDAEGNAYAGLDQDGLAVTAASDPQLTHSEPLAGAIEFQVDQNIRLFFDENVMAGSGNIIITNGVDTRTIAIDDTSQVDFNSFSGKVSINPVEDLLGDTEYSIQIAPGVITDTAGNAYAGNSDITFATIATDPIMLSSNPTNHTAMKADANIELVFNRTVKAGLGDIIISNGTDTRTIAITDTSQVTFFPNVVTIDPKDDLILNTTYTVQMAGGVIADTAGHDYPGFKDATTSILSPNPLLFQSSLDGPGGMLVDDNITFFFDEAVTAGRGNIIISNGSDTRTIAANDTSQISFEFGVLTVNPIEDLIPDTSYTIQIESGAITDLNGYIYQGITGLEVTPIDSNPFITVSNIRSSFKVDDDIQLFFNEAVEAGDGNIVISNGTDTRTIAIGDTSQITLSPVVDSFGSGEYTVLTINPATDLIANTTYSIQIDQGIVTDVAGHEFAGLNEAKFSAIASDPLLIINPESESTIEIDDDIQLFFDEEVQAGTGSIVLSNGTDTRIIAVDDTSQVSFSVIPLYGVLTTTDVTVDESVVSGSFALTINPTEDLVANTTYTVQMNQGVVTDTAGHAYSGLDDITFSTMTSEPRLLSSNPVNGSTIKTDGNIELQFDEVVVAGNGNIILSNGVDTRVIGIRDTSQVSFGGTQVTINPTEDLIGGTVYSVQMVNGAITDEAGNLFAGFSDAKITATNSNPLLTGSNPVAGSVIKIDGDIRLQFDEPVVAGSGNIILSNGSDTRTIAMDDASQVAFITGGKSVSINPTEDLISNTTYTVEMDAGAITDEAGNPFAGFSNATVMATDAPILFLSPGANLIATNSAIHLSFDEEIVPGTGNIILSNGEDVRTIAVNDASQVTFNKLDKTSVTIHPSQDLVSNAVYQIQMASGAIVDTDGNPYGGISEGDMINIIARELDVDPIFAPLP